MGSVNKKCVVARRDFLGRSAGICLQLGGGKTGSGTGSPG